MAVRVNHAAARVNHAVVQVPHAAVRVNHAAVQVPHARRDWPAPAIVRRHHPQVAMSNGDMFPLVRFFVRQFLFANCPGLNPGSG
jgi:hypothetical protein